MQKPNIGDYFVVRTTGIAARLIQIGTMSKWNHAGIYIGHNQVVEARPSGVSISPLSKYDNNKIIWNTGFEKGLTKEKGLDIAEFAKGFINDGYGIWSILALAFRCFGISLLPLEYLAEHENQVVCSQLVAWAYSHCGIKLTNSPHALVTPKNLATRLSRK